MKDYGVFVTAAYGAAAMIWLGMAGVVYAQLRRVRRQWQKLEAAESQ
ncbi:MAG: heme exporter protein CcmD [Holosporales bacterium]